VDSIPFALRYRVAANPLGEPRISSKFRIGRNIFTPPSIARESPLRTVQTVPRIGGREEFRRTRLTCGLFLIFIVKSAD